MAFLMTCCVYHLRFPKKDEPFFSHSPLKKRDNVIWIDLFLAFPLQRYLGTQRFRTLQSDLQGWGLSCPRKLQRNGTLLDRP